MKVSILHLTQVWLQLVIIWKRNGQNKKCIPNITSWPQVTFDLGMWPLTSFTYEGFHIASTKKKCTPILHRSWGLYLNYHIQDSGRIPVGILAPKFLCYFTPKSWVIIKHLCKERSLSTLTAPLHKSNKSIWLVQWYWTKQTTADVH